MTLQRKIANMFYGIGHAFESAKVSLSRGNPHTLNPTDASAELPSYTRNELVRKARYLEKNSGHIRGILQDLKVYGSGKGAHLRTRKRFVRRKVGAQFGKQKALRARSKAPRHRQRGFGKSRKSYGAKRSFADC